MARYFAASGLDFFLSRGGMAMSGENALRVGFLVGFLTFGFILWPVPYEDLDLVASSSLRLALLVVVGAAFLVRRLGKAPFVRSVLWTGLAVPAAVIVKIVLDLSRDSTAHNLAPVEVLFGLVPGLLAAAAGAALGSIPALFREPGGAG
ncbi:MAG: hypothetical protein KJZ47_14660 [Gemmatimonadales bacterium]|nr:hypothetical protein [Gemmatimonadales bacterium]